MINLRLPSVTSPDYGLGATPTLSGGNSSPLSATGNNSKDLRLPDAGAAPQAQQQPTEAELRQAVANLQLKAQKAAPNLQFSIDRDTSRLVIRVTDSTTRGVIQQFPPEEVLRMDRELDRLQGMLLNREA